MVSDVEQCRQKDESVFSSWGRTFTELLVVDRDATDLDGRGMKEQLSAGVDGTGECKRGFLLVVYPYFPILRRCHQR